MSDTKMLTHDQHEALLESAVQKASEDAASAARKDADAEVLALNEQLATAQAEIAELQAKVEAFTNAEAEREEAERVEALADERVELVKEVASFTDEQVAKRRLEWAKMDEAAFAALVEDYKTIAAPPSDKKETKKVTTTFDGTRETASEDEGFIVTKLFAGQSAVN